MIILQVGIAFIVFIVIFHLMTKRYLNPYKLIMIFGKKGSGKSTLQVKLALDHIKNGWTVYCTTKLPGCYYVPENLIGTVEFKPNSVLLVDEVGMIWDNRDFKNFSSNVRDWFKLQRHRKVKVYLFSQSFDVDKKIRDLVDEMYLITRSFRVFSYANKISRNIIITKATSESASSLADELKFESLFFFWCGSRKLTFIPKYIKYFDSYEASKLKEYNFDYMPVVKYTHKQKKLIKLEENSDNKISWREKVCYMMLRVFRGLIIKIKRISKF
jgi:hypothetical protein